MVKNEWTRLRHQLKFEAKPNYKKKRKRKTNKKERKKKEKKFLLYKCWQKLEPNEAGTRKYLRIYCKVNMVLNVHRNHTTHLLRFQAHLSLRFGPPLRRCWKYAEQRQWRMVHNTSNAAREARLTYSSNNPRQSDLCCTAWVLVFVSLWSRVTVTRKPYTRGRLLVVNTCCYCSHNRKRVAWKKAACWKTCFPSGFAVRVEENCSICSGTV